MSGESPLGATCASGELTPDSPPPPVDGNSRLPAAIPVRPREGVDSWPSEDKLTPRTSRRERTARNQRSGDDGGGSAGGEAMDRRRGARPPAPGAGGACAAVDETLPDPGGEVSDGGARRGDFGKKHRGARSSGRGAVRLLDGDVCRHAAGIRGGLCRARPGTIKRGEPKGGAESIQRQARSPCRAGELERCDALVPEAVGVAAGQRSAGVVALARRKPCRRQSSDRNRVGICLSGGDRDGVLVRRRRRGPAQDRLVWRRLSSWIYAPGGVARS